MEEASEAEMMAGKFYFDNGATYEGQWKYVDFDASEIASDAVSEENKKRVRHGKGQIFFAAPRANSDPGTYIEGNYSYNGEWHEDQMHGSGKFCFASGNVYRGEFQANAYHGQGSFTWADGTGSWLEGKMHGEGSYVDKEGRKWDGQFYNGSGPGLKCRL